MPKKKMDRNVSEVVPEAWRIATTLNFCLAKIVGKYAAYPQVDSQVFRRIRSAVESGLRRRSREAKLGDFCQELRAVASCPTAELLRSAGSDETDSRIAAIAQVVREYASLDDALFRELLTGLLSWEPKDKDVILKALVGIVRG